VGKAMLATNHEVANQLGDIPCPFLESLLAGLVCYHSVMKVVKRYVVQHLFQNLMFNMWYGLRPVSLAHIYT